VRRDGERDAGGVGGIALRRAGVGPGGDRGDLRVVEPARVLVGMAVARGVDAVGGHGPVRGDGLHGARDQPGVLVGPEAEEADPALPVAVGALGREDRGDVAVVGGAGLRRRVGRGGRR
jgi:hypothetical protein